jgi:hypothetical protein
MCTDTYGQILIRLTKNHLIEFFFFMFDINIENGFFIMRKIWVTHVGMQTDYDD